MCEIIPKLFFVYSWCTSGMACDCFFYKQQWLYVDKVRYSYFMAENDNIEFFLV